MTMKAPNTIIIQRVIPHYRVALFRRLFEDYSVRVVTAQEPPSRSFLNLADPRDLPFAIPAPFVFPDASDAFRARVPTDWILRTVKPDSVIAEFGMRMSSSYKLAWLRRTGRLRRLAFWSHGWQMERGFDGIVDWTIQHARLPLFAAADVVATYTNEGADWVRHQLPKQKVLALGNSLDTAAIGRSAVGIPPIRYGSPQLLVVGRLTADKQIERALQVYEEVRRVFPDAALTVIGDGPERANLENLARAQQGGRAVHFLGIVYDEAALAPHFLGADFFVLPGAAGLAVNHALAYALPIVAFQRGPQGPRHHPEIEYVVDGQSGILIAEPKAAAMAQSIILAYRTGAHRILRNKLGEGLGLPTMDDLVLQFERLLIELNV